MKRLEMLREWARHDANTYRSFKSTLESFGRPLRGARVLDIGCGTNAPMTVILHSAGVSVTGIDDHVGYRWGLGFRLRRYARYYREAGLRRTARKFAGEFVFDRAYYNSLARFVGFALTDESIDIRCMSAETLEFPPASFDIVHSNATWEHLGDPAAVNRELVRVLRPGGVGYIEIHLFPSLSGGHDLPWIVPGRVDMGNVTPWRHLRDPLWQPPVRLNRLREREYRAQFEQTPGLEIVDWRTEFREGAELLTPEIQRALPDYSTEELTKRSVIVVIRRVH